MSYYIGYVCVYKYVCYDLYGSYIPGKHEILCTGLLLKMGFMFLGGKFSVVNLAIVVIFVYLKVN
jgi:hypothetical protein